MNYGMRVSKPGYDVLTDADGQMAFTSSHYSDKVTASMILGVNFIGGTTQSYLVVHSLGYPPLAKAWFFFDPQPSPVAAFQVPAYLGPNSEGLNISADININQNFIRVDMQTSSATSSTYSVRLLILEKSI